VERKNGRALPGATNATLALTNVQVADRGDFSVVVSNAAGATISPEARLSVRTPPEVSIAPTQAVGYVGTDAGFVATLAGNDFFTFQWRHNGTNLIGETNEILLITNLSAAAGGAYDVVASTIGGTATSSAVGAEDFRRSDARGRDSSPQRVSRQSYNAAALVLLKFSPDGPLLWSRFLTGTNVWSGNHPLAVDAEGNSTLGLIYRTGRCSTPLKENSCCNPAAPLSAKRRAASFG